MLALEPGMLIDMISNCSFQFIDLDIQLTNYCLG